MVTHNYGREGLARVAPETTDAAAETDAGCSVVLGSETRKGRVT